MTLLTRAFILERYGVRLTMGQLATLLAMSEGTIRNQVSAETFPIPTYEEERRATPRTTPWRTISTRCPSGPVSAQRIDGIQVSRSGRKTPDHFRRSSTGPPCLINGRTS